MNRFGRGRCKAAQWHLEECLRVLKGARGCGCTEQELKELDARIYALNERAAELILWRGTLEPKEGSD